MATAIIMPRFGMTQEEATIVRWIVKDGERVDNGDPLCEVTTDKVNMEVEAPADGILAGLRYSEGDTVPVTEIIAYIVVEGEAPPATESPVERKPAGSPPGTLSSPPEHIPEIRATPVARRMADAEGIKLAAVPGSGTNGEITRQDVANFLSRGEPAGRLSPVKSIEQMGKPRATPAARRLARERQVELDRLEGSGPLGRVQGWDVPVFTDERTAPVPDSGKVFETPFASAQPEIIKLEGMRRTIAERMQASWQTIPHITFTAGIDMGRAVAMRASFNARAGNSGLSISMTAVLVKACAAALRQHPALNSYFREDEILVLPEVNVGVAVALESGLIVPVVRQADAKSLLEVAQEVVDLSRRAREGRLRPEDVVDGTFTLSNLGMFGVDQFTAIINPPQVAILATGRIVQRYMMDEVEGPAWRPVMTATLSVDHRAADGATAARFLATLRGILETAGSQWG